MHATWSIQTSLLVLCRRSIFARNYRVIWKDLWWTADCYRHIKHRGGCTIPLFQLSVWCEKGDAARHYAVIGKQLLISNDRNRVRWVVLGLSQDGAALICLKILAWTVLRETYRMLPLSTHLFSHWLIPLSCHCVKNNKRWHAFV